MDSSERAELRRRCGEGPRDGLLRRRRDRRESLGILVVVFGGGVPAVRGRRDRVAGDAPGLEGRRAAVGRRLHVPVAPQRERGRPGGRDQQQLGDGRRGDGLSEGVESKVRSGDRRRGRRGDLPSRAASAEREPRRARHRRRPELRKLRGRRVVPRPAVRGRGRLLRRPSLSRQGRRLRGGHRRRHGPGLVRRPAASRGKLAHLCAHLERLGPRVQRRAPRPGPGGGKKDPLALLLRLRRRRPLSRGDPLRHRKLRLAPRRQARRSRDRPLDVAQEPRRLRRRRRPDLAAMAALHLPRRRRHVPRPRRRPDASHERLHGHHPPRVRPLAALPRLGLVIHVI
mmetsp:Transcript_6044/g.19698  ORF Transcript_6044/g.19698 Transcript_6044/m.19698 type:complete len:341 (+) Transcript_6044:605-1627(+)